MNRIHRIGLSAVFIALVIGCASTRLIPVPSEEAYVTRMGEALEIKKEGIAFEVSQGKNPRGAGSDIATFLLTARNYTDQEIELVLDHAILVDSMGTQYENMIVREVEVHRHTWWVSHGGYFYRPWGWYSFSHPVTVTETERVTDRNFRTGPYTILPHAQIRGALFFPCRLKDSSYVRLILTRLIKEKEEPGSKPNTIRTTYRKVKYEFEFNVRTS